MDTSDLPDMYATTLKFWAYLSSNSLMPVL